MSQVGHETAGVVTVKLRQHRDTDEGLEDRSRLQLLSARRWNSAAGRRRQRVSWMTSSCR